MGGTCPFRIKMLYCLQMKLEREKWIRYVALGVTVILVLMSLILWLLLRRGGHLEAGLRLPRVTPVTTATPSPTPAQVVVTPAPTPLVVQVERDYPPEAMDLVADGRVLFTAFTAEDAQTALQQYLEEGAKAGLGNDERLIRAGFDQKLTIEDPSGKGELLSVEEAVNSLKADEGLLPIARTVVRCVIEQGERDTVLRKNDRLLTGSRIYRSMGVYPYTLSYYETVYRGQAAFSELKTNEFAVGTGGADYVVEDGTCVMGEASREAGPEAETVSGFSPQWPLSGAVAGSFGMTDEGMRYGTEITAGGSNRVTAPEEGVIVYCGQRGDLGLVIDILHDETGVLSRIIGCKEASVELYQRVKKGDPIAKLAEPSIGQKISIRYEILLDGLPVNQEKYLPKR